MNITRRQILQALGLGVLPPGMTSRAGTPSAVASLARARSGGNAPSRVVFYVQPHGHIPDVFNMTLPGGPTGAFAEMPLVDLQPGDFSAGLAPLYPFRDRLLAIEGLCHTSALVDIEDVTVAGAGDPNNHQVGVACALTCDLALQQKGTYCTGGAISVDQLLAQRLAGPGRYGSRVYGFDYVPNSVVSPFSYLGPGQATPMVSDPSTALADLMEYLAPTPKPQSRQQLLSSLRGSVLDAVADEYEQLGPQLGSEGRAKLQAHATLVRQLEASLGSAAPPSTCDATLGIVSDGTMGTAVRQFMKLVQIAFACDLTRVVAFTAPVPPCPELGYPGDTTFHGYAHASLMPTSCGVAYSPLAAQAMKDLDVWHANHVAYLLAQLDAVPEGDGTELPTPTHLHNDVFTVLAGGCNGFFKTGRYVSYPRTFSSPRPNMPLIGPPQNRLHVSLLQAMGQPDDTFGMTSATGYDGTPLAFDGPLVELEEG